MKVKLGECFYQIRNGANIKQGIEGGYPITRIETIANDKFNRNRMGYAGIYDLAKYEEYILEDGDLLMSHINSIKFLGRAVRYQCKDNEKIIHGMNLLRLKVIRRILLPNYVEYYFKSIHFKKQLTQIIKKSVNQASFTVADLKNINIDVPELIKQKKIASVLDKLQSIITLRKEQLAKLDELVKARFVGMFGDVFKNGQDLLGNCCEINPAKIIFNDSRKVSFIPMANVKEDGSVDVTITKQYEEVKTGFTSFIDGDVLFAKITPCMENGKGCIVNNLCNGVGFGSTEFHILRPIKNVTNSYWLYVLTKSFKLRHEAAVNMTGSAGQRRVPANFLKSYRVTVPPIELQNQFADFVQQVDKSKVAVQKALDKTQMLFDSLMQEYFG